MKKLDLRKEFKELYSPPTKQVVMVNVPAFNFLMIDGVGNPNTAQEYQDALAALYGVAYTLKFAIKKGEALDYPVMPLEGLWWVAGVEQFSMDELMARKDDWHWTMMVMQPVCVTRAHVKRALVEIAEKKDWLIPKLIAGRLTTRGQSDMLRTWIFQFSKYATTNWVKSGCSSTFTPKVYTVPSVARV